MSEANNVWRVELGGTEHEIEVEHSTMSGRFTVKLDGQVVGEDRMLFSGKQVDFDVAGHPARVKLDNKYAGFAQGSTLHVDERYVEPLRR